MTRMFTENEIGTLGTKITFGNDKNGNMLEKNESSGKVSCCKFRIEKPKMNTNGKNKLEISTKQEDYGQMIINTLIVVAEALEYHIDMQIDKERNLEWSQLGCKT